MDNMEKELYFGTIDVYPLKAENTDINFVLNLNKYDFTGLESGVDALYLEFLPVIAGTTLVNFPAFRLQFVDCDEKQAKKAAVEIIKNFYTMYNPSMEADIVTYKDEFTGITVYGMDEETATTVRFSNFNHTLQKDCVRYSNGHKINLHTVDAIMLKIDNDYLHQAEKHPAIKDADEGYDIPIYYYQMDKWMLGSAVAIDVEVYIDTMKAKLGK